jgi:uncharacterized protein (DUF4415 family)
MASRKPPPPPDFDEDAPELTDEQIKQLRPAKEYFAELGIPIPKMGRPKAEAVKRSVTIRMDEDVIEHFKAGGPGWQTRMHEVLAGEARKKRD